VAEPMQRRRRRGWRRFAIEAAIFLAVLAGIRAWTQRDVARGEAPPLQGVSPDGRPLSLEALRGQPVMVHFWASWCSVCRLEQGSVAALAREHAVITVASQSGDAAKVAAYLKAENLGFPVVIDEDGALARRFGVNGFPTTFFVGPEGRIRSTEVGYTTGLGMRLRMWLAGR
jgi:thiol-disulfide isomerase/thioredoxin